MLRLHLDRKLVVTAAFVEVGMVAMVPACQKAGRVRGAYDFPYRSDPTMGKDIIARRLS